MQHIASLLANLSTYVSRDEVLRSRFIEITEDFLKIRVKSDQVEIGERLLLVQQLTYAEKIIITKEKQSLIGYVCGNNHGFTIQDIIVR